MHLTEEQRCLLWLSAAKITPAHATMLAEAYGGVQGVWDAYGCHGGPEFPSQARKALSPLHSRAAMDSLIDRLEQKNVRLLFQGDERYPSRLAKLDGAPYLLYYAGSLDCLERPMVALVGTRQPSAYGREMARMLTRGLCEAGVCVVSGLARGIDLAVHESALEAGGYTVGVLGSGINVPYPPEHRPLLRKIAGGIGLILSEYPLDAQPLPYHFPHRNRIISGLSLGVVFGRTHQKRGNHHRGRCAFAGTRGVRSSRLRGYNRRGRPASYSPGGWAHRYQRRRHFGGSGPWPQARRTRTG